MQDLLDQMLSRLVDRPAVCVTVARTEGSAPRETGSWLVVWSDEVMGSIGGGQLEWQAIARSRLLLANAALPACLERHALGPSLGQCCGGVVHLQFERIQARDAPALRQRLAPALRPLALFGGGHVGHAIVGVMLTLPYRITWIDSRDGVFAPGLPERVHCEHSEPVHRAVDDLPAGSQVLIMSFSHAEDLDIVAQCLRRQHERGDLPFIGLIGSQTKWAVFRKRLQARGFTPEQLAQVTCPIGLPGIAGKQPQVIAVAVAAQLLMQG
jgi:xanthine dehydrogenase accessory factor